MVRASRAMLFHYTGYFGSIVLVWLVMISALLKNQPAISTFLSALLLLASLLFGIVGLLYIVRGGHRGGKE